jgi:cytidylate kinase
MPKKRIITICGLPGSGKSSTANRLAELLAYRRFSSGDFMRQIGIKRGLSIDQMQKQAESDKTIDEAIDEEIRQMGQQEDLVMDSRIAYHWIPESFKVFLKIDPKVAATRTHDHLLHEGRLGQQEASEDEIYQNLLARIESEKKRYASLYNINYLDETQYDLVVNTGEHTLDQVVQLVSEGYQAWQK